MTILNPRKARVDDRIEEMSEELNKGSKFVKFSMNIPRELHAQFRRKSFLSDKDMKDILLKAIYEYVNEE